MTHITRGLIGAAALITLASVAHAAPIPSSTSTSAGVPLDTPSLTGFQTTGNDMGGSVVTVRFADGSSSSAAWVNGGGTAGSASTGIWSLSLNGDSFNTPWQFKNIDAQTIVGFSFDGLPGKTVFDIVNGPTDSPGSANGNPYGSVDGPASITFSDGAYTNQVLIAGTFYGDLYSLLDVQFKGGLRANGVVTFIADTDSVGLPIPEPETYALMLAGLGLVSFVARRRRL